MDGGGNVAKLDLRYRARRTYIYDVRLSQISNVVNMSRLGRNGNREGANGLGHARIFW